MTLIHNQVIEAKPIIIFHGNSLIGGRVPNWLRLTKVRTN